MRENRVMTVYGLPGSHILDIYNVLRDEKHINSILAMHEINKPFMADAHGRLTDKPLALVDLTLTLMQIFLLCIDRNDEW